MEVECGGIPGKGSVAGNDAVVSRTRRAPDPEVRWRALGPFQRHRATQGRQSPSGSLRPKSRSPVDVQSPGQPPRPSPPPPRGIAPPLPVGAASRRGLAPPRPDPRDGDELDPRHRQFPTLLVVACLQICLPQRRGRPRASRGACVGDPEAAHALPPPTVAGRGVARPLGKSGTAPRSEADW